MGYNIKPKGNMMEGVIHKTNNCGEIEIVKYESALRVRVRFLDTSSEITTRAALIRVGQVKDPIKPKIFGVGFLGAKKLESKKDVYIYDIWHKILSRCYSDLCQNKNSTYKGCSVDDDWHNFQNFAKWYKENKPENGERYHIDKDLLFVGNKVYSRETCVLVPRWLNAFTTDSRSARGELPIGVSYYKPNGKFMAQCGIDGKGRNLGYYKTKELAYEAWERCKIDIAKSKKQLMDAIDRRIYPNIITIITNHRVGVCN